MAVNEEYLKFILDQLSLFGNVETKKMFGGIGFFKEGIMFAMIGQNAFRLRVDESSIPDFEAKGMKPMFSDAKKKSMPYWEVPLDVLENKDELARWTHKAYTIAVKAKK